MRSKEVIMVRRSPLMVPSIPRRHKKPREGRAKPPVAKYPYKYVRRPRKGQAWSVPLVGDLVPSASQATGLKFERYEYPKEENHEGIFGTDISMAAAAVGGIIALFVYLVWKRSQSTKLTG